MLNILTVKLEVFRGFSEVENKGWYELFNTSINFVWTYYVYEKKRELKDGNYYRQR